MAWYLVEIRYVQEKFREVRPAHRDYLLELAEQGKVAVAGPLADSSGGVVIYQAEDTDELNKLLDNDPYHLEGAIAERSVREYVPVLGSWVPGQG